MTPPDLVSAAEDERALEELNRWLDARDASARIAWALRTLPGEHVLSSSFGAQSAALLHLVTRHKADIPVVPVSIQPEAGPAHAFAMGRALASLREEGVLVIGSGSITHNLGDFRAGYSEAREAPYVRPFTDWIEQRLAAGDVDALLDYRHQAPFAERAHPTDEHLLPLFVALGAAGTSAQARRIDAGIDLGFLAMDIYRFDTATRVSAGQPSMD